MPHRHEQMERLSSLLTQKQDQHNADEHTGFTVYVSHASQRVSGQRTHAEIIPYVQFLLTDDAFYEEHPHLRSRWSRNVRTITIYFNDRLFDSMSTGDMATLLWRMAIEWKDTNRVSKTGKLHYQVYEVTKGRHTVLSQYPNARQVKELHSLA